MDRHSLFLCHHTQCYFALFAQTLPSGCKTNRWQVKWKCVCLDWGKCFSIWKVRGSVHIKNENNIRQFHSPNCMKISSFACQGLCWFVDNYLCPFSWGKTAKYSRKSDCSLTWQNHIFPHFYVWNMIGFNFSKLSSFKDNIKILWELSHTFF